MISNPLKTSDKIFIARMLSAAVRTVRHLAGKSNPARVRRGGIRWELDLNEGIDFSIYLIGGFEPRTLKLYRKIVQPGQTVVDVGANIGSHTLPLAKRVGNGGIVAAFEPTAFAYRKLVANVALNPELSRRIVPLQTMLAGNRGAGLAPSLFSSWPLEKSGDLHAAHKGRRMDTSGAAVATMDDVLDRLGIGPVDFIKIDVDGHEHEVLKGALQTLKSFRPALLMEFAPYLIEKEDFYEMVALLQNAGYRFFDANSLRPLPVRPDPLDAMIPAGASLNVYCSCTGSGRMRVSGVRR